MPLISLYLSVNTYLTWKTAVRYLVLGNVTRLTEKRDVIVCNRAPPVVHPAHELSSTAEVLASNLGRVGVLFEYAKCENRGKQRKHRTQTRDKNLTQRWDDPLMTTGGIGEKQVLLLSYSSVR